MNQNEAIYDARQLGLPKMLILGLQHMFAMFGATVLVPILVSGYGLPLSIQTTLLFAGLGTLLFHLCTKFKVPAFLGSSFAYLGGFATVASLLGWRLSWRARDALRVSRRTSPVENRSSHDPNCLFSPNAPSKDSAKVFRIFDKFCHKLKNVAIFLLTSCP